MTPQARYERTAKGKATRKRYDQSEKGKATYAKYRATEAWRIVVHLFERKPARRLNKRLRRQERAVCG